MNIHLWLAYFVAAWLIALSPGAGAVLSMSHGLSYGVRQATATILGLQTGLALILLLAGGGVGALLMASATAFTVVKVLGAVYLFWLGVKQWRAPATAASVTHGTAISEGARLTAKQRYVRGLLTNATNPKGIVFMVAVLPQFISPNRPLWTQLAILLVTTLCVDVTVMHGYALLAASLRRWLATPRAQRARNRVTGSVLMAMGASLIFVSRVAKAR